MMSSSDAIIWNIENDPQLRSTVMSVWILDEEPTPERMAANIDRMVAAIPRLRQRVLGGRPRPRWDPIDDLDLNEHYVAEQLSPGSTMSDALSFAERWVREPFDRDRPLWKLGLLTGLEGGKAAIVIKVHHAIADGMGMVLMLGAFTDFELNPRLGPVADTIVELPVARRVFTPMKRFAAKVAHGAKTLVSDPMATLADFTATVRSAVRLVTPHRVPHSTLMVRRSEELSMATRTIAFDDFKARATAENVTMNDLFVSIVGDALTEHHERHGADCPKLRVHVPVDIRTGRTSNLAGNQFVPARISLDLRGAAGSARRGHIAMQLDALCDEPALGHINTVSAAIQKLGRPVSRWIIGGMMKGVDVLASNVPGPDFPLFLAGSQVEQFFGFGPPAGAALNATMFSYDGTIWIGLTIDDAAIEDRDQFLDCLDQVIATTFAVDETHLRTAS